MIYSDVDNNFKFIIIYNNIVTETELVSDYHRCTIRFVSCLSVCLGAGLL